MNASLNTAILQCLNQAKKDAEAYKKQGSDTYYYTFYSSIPKSYYTDYNDFVPREKEIYLENVDKKAKKQKYQSVEEFIRDIEQIAENAEAYHTHGSKRVAHIPQLALGLLEYMKSAIMSRLPQGGKPEPKYDSDGIPEFDSDADY